MVGVFNEWGVLLYIAREKDTDEEALNAAKRRGLDLCGIIVVKRSCTNGMITQRYGIEQLTGGKLKLYPIND